MKKIVVFCGANEGRNPMFKKKAFELGSVLAKQKATVIYGGGNSGLMAEVASGVLDSHGEIIGVLPRFLKDREGAFEGLTELVLCNSIEERKDYFYQNADAYIALPGGIGTLDEIIELLMMGNFNNCHKPVGLLNINGFYSNIFEHITLMQKNGFVGDLPIIKEEEVSSLVDRITKRIN